MSILVLKTNLKKSEDVKIVQPIFNLHPSIIDWHVDTEDIDNVLRIQSSNDLTEMDVVRLLKQYQIQTEIFTD